MTTIQNKDLDLKLMCKLLFTQMNYNSHFEIKLRTKSYINSIKSHDISDIDVLGLRFNEDMTYYSVGAECKSGESNALEEFFKFLGIMDYYKLDKGYFIKSKIHQNTRQIAINKRFSCLTEAELRGILLGFGINLDKSLKIENVKFQRLTKALDFFKKKNEKLVDYISLDYWNKENWKNIHNLIHILGQSNPEIAESPNSFDKLIHYYVLEIFSIACLRNLSEAMVLNYSDIDNAIINSLYGGAESLNEKRKIHDAVNLATKESKDFSPVWQSDFVSICSRLSQYTLASSKIPSLIQQIRENAFYDYKVSIEQKITRKYPDLTRKFTQDIAFFLSKHSNLSEKIFEDVMKL